MADYFGEIERRTVQHYFLDGLYEMAVGAIFLLLGLLSLGSGLLPMGSAWGMLWILGSIGITFWGSRLAFALISRAKEKYTYPRIGFISYRRPCDSNKAGFGWRTLLRVSIAAFAVTLFRNSVGFSWSIAGGGLLCALLFLYIAVRTGLARIYILSGLVMAVAIVLGQLRLGRLFELSIFGCCMGMLICITGAIVFRRFIKNNPVGAGPAAE